MARLKSLYDLVEWTRQNGAVDAMFRVRVKLLEQSTREGIYLGDVGPDVRCSQTFLEAFAKAATEVVGKPCPLSPEGLK